jgi:hypothetical protein
MTYGDWPHVGDAPLQRARRVALTYRMVLEHVAPQRCAAVDEQMRQWGQLWAVPRLQTKPDDEHVNAREAAELASVGVDTISKWRRRGIITGRQLGPRTWRYSVEEITRAASMPRTRGRQ